MAIINDDRPAERRRMGLVFDDRMCKHIQPDELFHPEIVHPENPNRILAIWDRLNASGLAQRCTVLNAKEAKDNQLALVHSKEHIELIKTISSKDISRMRTTAAEFDSIYFNQGSSEASSLAAGSVVEAAEKVAKGELDSAFAIVRPPGHHAEEAEPMGFCLYNNVATAASFLLNERPELGIGRILIVDWDVHHGNGTQKMFYNDPRVLFFSVHRHDSGKFYPYGNDGSYEMTGEGAGAGYNINVPWENGSYGDADYFAVWDHILVPVAKEFDPDLIMISAGFDAALGDPIGGCCLSPYAYSVMLGKLMTFARGKIVMALEGGYNPSSLADSAEACVKELLQDKPLHSSSKDPTLRSTWPLIKAVRQALSAYWPVLAAKLPKEVIYTRISQTEIDVEVSHIARNAANAGISRWQAKSRIEQVHTADTKIDPKRNTDIIFDVASICTHIYAGSDSSRPSEDEGAAPIEITHVESRIGEKRARPNDDYITLENTRGTVGDDYDLEDMSTKPTSTVLKAITDNAYRMLTTVNVLKAKEEKECETERHSKEEISHLKGEVQRPRSKLKGTMTELEHGRQDLRGMNSAYHIIGNKYIKERISGKKFLSLAHGKDFVAYLREKVVSEYRASPTFEEEVM